MPTDPNVDETRRIYQIIARTRSSADDQEYMWVVTLNSGDRIALFATAEQAVAVEEAGYEDKIVIARDADIVLLPPYANPFRGREYSQEIMEEDSDAIARMNQMTQAIRTGEYTTPEQRITYPNLVRLPDHQLRSLALEFEIYGDATGDLVRPPLSAGERELVIHDIIGEFNDQQAEQARLYTNREGQTRQTADQPPRVRELRSTDPSRPMPMPDVIGTAQTMGGPLYSTEGSTHIPFQLGGQDFVIHISYMGQDDEDMDNWFYTISRSSDGNQVDAGYYETRAGTLTVQQVAQRIIPTP